MGENTYFSPSKRCCLYCGKRLSPLARANREYCSDSCRVRANRPTASRAKPKPNGGEPPQGDLEPLRELCQLAADAKGRDTVAELFQRLGIRRIDADLKPQQEQALRAGIEALLS